MAKTSNTTPRVPLRHILATSRKLLALAWRMDARLTFLYYSTAAIGALVPLASSYILKLLIDDLEQRQNAFPITIPVIIVVILAARYLVSFVDNVIFWGINQSYLDYVFRYKLQNELTWRFHQKIAGLDIAHFENAAVQDLITKTRDTMQWRLPNSLRTMGYVVNDVVAFLAAFIALIPFGWWVPLVVTVIAAPRLYLQAKYGAIQWSMWDEGAPQAKELWYLNYLLQDPMTVRETRIGQSSGILLKKLHGLQTFLFKLNKKALDRYLRVLTLPPIIEAVIIFFIAYHFLDPVLAAAISIGSFTLLINMLEQLGSRAANTSAHFAEIYEGNLYVMYYFEFLDLPKLLPMPEKPVVLKKVEPPLIEFRNVSFSYPNGPKVLDNVSFTIQPGESVALVGHNGAGKTTIIKLLCRFYDVTRGGIYVNGTNIKDLDLNSWYRHLGTLFQEFVKYHFTVRENIAMGDPRHYDAKAMRAAAHKAGAADFIKKLPKRYDQLLGKEFAGGEDLSGGQWQKLAIARAFYEQPPVLILDEPTSAIDAGAEYEIFSNIEAQYKNKTLILVSHRFSTVRNASNIIVIEGGKIIESGTHDELMAREGQYAKLFSLQARGYR